LGIPTNVVLHKGRGVTDVLEKFAGCERGCLGWIAQEQAGDVGPAARSRGIFARESVVKIERDRSPHAVVIRPVVADAAPVHPALQAVASDVLGDAADEVPRIGDEIAVIAATSGRSGLASTHLVAGIVILVGNDRELRSLDSTDQGGAE